MSQEPERQLLITFSFPAWVFAVLVLVMMTGFYGNMVTDVLLLRQRVKHDAEFMAKIEQVRQENAALRKRYGLE